MHWETIREKTAPAVPPRLTDYDRVRSAFTWSQARAELSGLPGGGLNMAHEAVDRHAASGNADKVALRCIARDDSVTAVTYAELMRRTSRFAGVLRSLGIGRGDRVLRRWVPMKCPTSTASGPRITSQPVTASTSVWPCPCAAVGSSPPRCATPTLSRLPS